MGSDIFTNIDGLTSSMNDEHQIVKIKEKSPMLLNIGKIIRGDTNSNIVTFEINRYYDGVDLSTKKIKFIIKNKEDIFVENAVNLQTTDELLRFSWIISYNATRYSGVITVAIEFLGIEEDKNYLLNTIPFSVKVEDTLDANDMSEPYTNWFVDVENKLDTYYEIYEDVIRLNIDVLAKLNESEEGELLFDGEKIKGVPGEDGKTYTPKIGSVISGDTPAATVDISEEELTATFNFTLPKGDKGEKGQDGQTGQSGKDGKTYTPKIGTVTTGETPSVSVDINEAENTATFNFTFLQGGTGADSGATDTTSSMTYEETTEFLNGDSMENPSYDGNINSMQEIDYNELINLPQINSIVLRDNKSLSDLGVDTFIDEKLNEVENGSY